MAAAAERRMYVNVMVQNVGYHEAAWRLPDSDPALANRPAHFVRMSQLAERGGLDAVFLADNLELPWMSPGVPQVTFEPTVLLAAMAMATTRIGLIGTLSTTYNEPYNLARRLATLDHLSGGRAAWNVVASGGREAGENFDTYPSARYGGKYERAAEFVDVCRRLWDSWDDEAFVADKESGVLVDEEKVHEIAHHGKYFDVSGPLNFARSPQGHPLLVQAGASDEGRSFAATYADLVFTAQNDLDEAVAFAADIRARAAAAGRDPDAVKVLPGAVLFVAESEAEATELAERLGSLVDPVSALGFLSWLLGFELTQDQLDQPLPEAPASDRSQSRQELLLGVARREGLTARQLLARLGGGRGHQTIVGTPEQVADRLEEWFRAGAADGFNLQPAVLPEGMSILVDRVMPELRRRGLVPERYAEGTLRERLGLSLPRRIARVS